MTDWIALRTFYADWQNDKRWEKVSKAMVNLIDELLANPEVQNIVDYAEHARIKIVDPLADLSRVVVTCSMEGTYSIWENDSLHQEGLTLHEAMDFLTSQVGTDSSDD